MIAWLKRLFGRTPEPSEPEPASELPPATSSLFDEERMRAWEERLTPEQHAYAMAMLLGGGWRPGWPIPAWVCAQAFKQAEWARPGPKLQ